HAWLMEDEMRAITQFQVAKVATHFVILAANNDKHSASTEHIIDVSAAIQKPQVLACVDEVGWIAREPMHADLRREHTSGIGEYCHLEIELGAVRGCRC